MEQRHDFEKLLGFIERLPAVDLRLPAVFKPVSPPPYLNGGVEFLSWVIASTAPSFTPDECEEWLEGRLPRPVDDPKQWEVDVDDETDDDDDEG